MLNLDSNYIRIGTNRIGGVTKTSNILGVSNGAVHFWIRERRVPNIDIAKKFAEISGMRLEQVRPV